MDGDNIFAIFYIYINNIIYYGKVNFKSGVY